ncbi:putative phenylalanine aminotransferase [Streptomyces sp. RB5]|uniref:Histidinol-phosphate aminotransferase n=1 Tax=Streptomyces smaragdinus TaxID=2585196 RepID=A0A7K0CCW8_9ACTN|nr:histidinol-phosphate transaminase [Streptomyces smaragdinus]MQY11310.1 putative phenylalanine aminotransferase [Streptomyces smaragdinus]
MSVPAFRPVLDQLPGYRATEGVYDGEPARPLSANESPDEPLPGVLAAVTAAGALAHRYPDPLCTALTRALARRHGVPEEAVLAGAGSVALLQALMTACARPGAEVVFPWRSFELYPPLAQLAGLRPVPVPLADHRNDLDAMADRITSDTRLVLVCNPNNPTGTVVGERALRAFLDRVPPDCQVVLDEAYFEYVRTPDTCSGLTLLGAYPNLAVTRTFSKAYGLAALRVGYLVGAPDVVEALAKVRLAYSVSGVAQEAALASLALEERLRARVDDTVAERTRMRTALLAAGFGVPESHSNFLWLPLGDDAAAFGRHCTAERIAVRTYDGEGVRVSVGSPGDNDAFLACAAAWPSAVYEPV